MDAEYFVDIRLYLAQGHPHCVQQSSCLDCAVPQETPFHTIIISHFEDMWSCLSNNTHTIQIDQWLAPEHRRLPLYEFIGGNLDCRVCSTQIR